MGTLRSESKMTSAGFAVTDEFPSTESPEFGTGVAVGSVLAFSSSEVEDGADSPSWPERTIELADFDLTSACNAARGLALRLFPGGTTAVIRVARMVLPIRSTFIVSPPSRRWRPRTFRRGDIQA